jgi:hypothetical protein
MIDHDRAEPSVRRQCELLRVCRSGLYYEPTPTSPEELALMRPDRRAAFEPPVLWQPQAFVPAAPGGKAMRIASASSGSCE